MSHQHIQGVPYACAALSSLPLLAGGLDSASMPIQHLAWHGPHKALPCTQAHSLGVHLTLPGIFYALALLRLPQLYMAFDFVRAVETMSELRWDVLYKTCMLIL